MDPEQGPVDVGSDTPGRPLEADAAATPPGPAQPGGIAIPPRRGVATAIVIGGVAGLALFLALGTASVQVGSRVPVRRSMPLADVWSRFVDALADGGTATLVRVGLYGAAAVLLAGAALGLWLAMTADGGEPGERGSRRA